VATNVLALEYYWLKMLNLLFFIKVVIRFDVRNYEVTRKFIQSQNFLRI